MLCLLAWLVKIDKIVHCPETAINCSHIYAILACCCHSTRPIQTMWAGQYGSVCLGVLFLYSLLVLKAQAQTFENGIVKCPDETVGVPFTVNIDGIDKTHKSKSDDVGWLHN